MRLFTASALLLLTGVALGNEITVNPRAPRVGEAVEITVRLEGTFAKTSSLRVPISNLVIDHGPSTSSEFRWINGIASRSKTFRYIARAQREGTATVGPIDLVDREGARLQLEAVTITVLPDTMPRSNDPAIALHQTRGRGGVFITVETDKSEAYLGEQVNVTWTLFSREPLRGFRLTAVPVLANFWTEEVPEARQETQQVVIAGEVLQKVVLRRVAVFSLKAGTLQIAPLEAIAEVLRQDDFFGGWGFFEGKVEDQRIRSASQQIQVRPLPAEAAAVGEFSLECSTPVVPPRGPVSLDVTISGTGNLRSVGAPRFDDSVDAAMEIQEQRMSVLREFRPIRMERTWRFLLFPRRAGTLRIPPVSFEHFNPALGENLLLRCGGEAVAVTQNNIAAPAPRRTAATPLVATNGEKPQRHVPLALGLAALLVSGAVWAGVAKWRSDLPLTVQLMARRTEPRELRRVLFDSVNAAGLHVTELFRQETPLGESFRSLHSLLDVMEKEPWEIDPSQPELRRRIREFSRQFKKRGRNARQSSKSREGAG